MRKINKPKLRFKEFKEDWKVKKIDDIAKVYDGTHQTPKYKNNGVPFVSAENIKDLYSSGKYISVEDFKSEYKNSKAEKGDLLMTRIGKIGIVNIVTENTPVAYYVTLALLKLNNKNDSRFNMYLIQADKVQRELWAKTLHIAFPPKINKNEIPKVNITTTNLEEQRQIGLFFDKIDNLIELKNNKIKSLERLKYGYLQKLFNDPYENKPKLRFNGFNDDWKTEKIKNIANFFSGGTPKVGNKEYYKKEIPFIRSSEINSNTTDLFISKKGLDNSSAKLVDKGTILYAMYGATSGKVAISKINGAINQAVLAIKTNKNIDKQFLVLFLEYVKNKIVSKYIQGGQGNLSASIIKNISFKIPKLEEQQKIGNIMTLIDKQINLQQKELDRLKTLKKGYLQKMFV